MTTTLKFYGSESELREIVRAISPGGRWVVGYEITEYHSLEGPKIRCYPNGTVYVQGKDGPAGEMFKNLCQMIRSRELWRELKKMQRARGKSSS
jgi:hypothetical protein